MKQIIETKHVNFVICRDAFKAINNLYLTPLSSMSETNIVSDSTQFDCLGIDHLTQLFSTYRCKTESA